MKKILLFLAIVFIAALGFIFVNNPFESIVKKEAAQIILQEQDIKGILGDAWKYSGEAISSGPLQEDELNSYDSDFTTPFVDFNSEGSVKGKLTLQVKVNVLKSGKKAKKALEIHKSTFANPTDYLSENINVGDQGFHSSWKKAEIFARNYVFLRKNVVVFMSYTIQTSGDSSKVDKTFIERNNVFGELGLNGINEQRIAKLQASRIAN